MVWLKTLYKVNVRHFLAQVKLCNFEYPKGLTIVLSALAIAAAIFYFLPFLGLLCFIVAGWTVYFFRDPDRVVIQSPGIILSPADGVVQSIIPSALPPELGGKRGYTRISIFLNIFNVHVNRIPIAGRVIKTVYHPGKFLNASFDKASTLNERQSTLLEVSVGEDETIEIAFVQIAGLIARRIVNEIEDDTEVRAGARFGIIKFGSRMDVYLPESYVAQVGVGQIAVGGETILATLFSSEDTRPTFVKM